jgi:hypothetical protein
MVNTVGRNKFWERKAHMKKGYQPKKMIILIFLIALSVAHQPAALGESAPELIPLIDSNSKQPSYLLGYASASTGEFVIKPQFSIASAFREGLARVAQKKIGFIDTAGKIVVPLQYDYAYSFHEGLAQVKVAASWGYIDKAGAIVAAPIYEDCTEFRDGLAQVKLNGRWGTIDTTGTFLIPPRFSSPPDFCEGLARIILNGKIGRAHV